MTAREFIDYCIAIATSTATEPTAAPVLDAQLALQFLIPPILREAVRRVSKRPNGLQSVVKPHFFTVLNGFAYLGATTDDLFAGSSGLEEEFSKSFQVGIVPDTLVRTISSVSKGAGNDVVSQVPDFTIDDEGRRIIILVGSTEVLNAFIETFSDSATVRVGSYETGDISTVIAAGATAKIYIPAVLEEGEFTPESLGLFSLVEQYADYQMEDAPLLPIFNVSGGKIFVKQTGGISDGSIIVVYGISVPQVVDEGSDIDASEDVLDTALVIAGALMRGEMMLSSLGIPETVMVKKNGSGK